MPIAFLKNNLPFSHVEHANQQIDALNKAPWFDRVGTGVLPGVERAVSWEDALLHADYSDEYTYGDYLQNLSNDVRGFASRTDRALYNKYWGKAHDAVNKPLSKFLQTDVLKLIPTKMLSPYVTSGIAGSLINFVAFGLVYGLVHEQLETHVQNFLQGHFPCGYRGEYPDGKLIVY